jgi:mRNA-degrading endonuclease RelE of RelBE toxin-antitoxin system
VNHYTAPKFWSHYEKLPEDIQKRVDKNFKLLKQNPRHPSLHFKKVADRYWSARVGRNYRALAVQTHRGIEWFWIGPHDTYERILNR